MRGRSLTSEISPYIPPPFLLSEVEAHASPPGSGMAFAALRRNGGWEGGYPPQHPSNRANIRAQHQSHAQARCIVLQRHRAAMQMRDRAGQ